MSQRSGTAMSETLSTSTELDSTECDHNDSILILNDDCLWNVFKLSDILTLCHLAYICKRFRAVAEIVFRRYHMDIILHSIQPFRNDYSISFGVTLTHFMSF